MSLEPEMPVQEPVASADEAAPRRNARSRDFDRELGAKLRAARVSTGMNQTALGKALGVSFQQVQKYESGRDRIAAGTLQKIGGVLGIHPGEFFGETAAPVGGVAELREAMSIAATMQKVVSPVVRKRLGALIEVLAGQDTAEHDVEQPADLPNHGDGS